VNTCTKIHSFTAYKAVMLTISPWYWVATCWVNFHRYLCKKIHHLGWPLPSYMHLSILDYAIFNILDDLNKYVYRDTVSPSNIICLFWLAGHVKCRHSVQQRMHVLLFGVCQVCWGYQSHRGHHCTRWYPKYLDWCCHPYSSCGRSKNFSVWYRC
jgi:hypothetical protein